MVERLLKLNTSNSLLLFGARGTGKSSLIKACLNEFAPQGLRLIEVDKTDLVDLPLSQAVDLIRGKKGTPVFLNIIPGDATDDSIRKAVTIVDADQLGGTMMEQLASLFDEDDKKEIRATRSRGGAPAGKSGGGKSGGGKTGRRAA